MSTDYEDLFRSWRARAREEPGAAAALPQAFAAGEAAALGPYGRQLTCTLWAALPLAAGDLALRRAAAEPVPPAGLARSAALLAATEAVALLGSRAVHGLTAELSVVAAVTPPLARALVGSALAGLGTGQEGAPELPEGWAVPPLAEQFPRLVRGFAAQTVDQEGLAAAVEPGRPLGPPQFGALAARSRRGCSLVQHLPALLRGLEEDGAPGELVEPARRLVAAADELHWRLAETGPGAAQADPLATGYQLLYAGAASLALRRHTGSLWAGAALTALLAELPGERPGTAVPAEALLDEAPLDEELRRRRDLGLPLTPFGA